MHAGHRICDWQAVVGLLQVNMRGAVVGIRILVGDERLIDVARGQPIRTGVLLQVVEPDAESIAARGIRQVIVLGRLAFDLGVIVPGKGARIVEPGHHLPRFQGFEKHPPVTPLAAQVPLREDLLDGESARRARGFTTRTPSGDERMCSCRLANRRNYWHSLITGF